VAEFEDFVRAMGRFGIVVNFGHTFLPSCRPTPGSSPWRYRLSPVYHRRPCRLGATVAHSRRPAIVSARGGRNRSVGVNKVTNPDDATADVAGKISKE